MLYVEGMPNSITFYMLFLLVISTMHGTTLYNKKINWRIEFHHFLKWNLPHFRRHKSSVDPGWILTDVLFDFVSETNLVTIISASFLFCKKVNQRETEYSGNEVEVKLSTRFSLKLRLLEKLEKVVNIFLIWTIRKEKQRSYGIKYISTDVRSTSNFPFSHRSYCFLALRKTACLVPTKH